ncbi:MAG: PIN domain-containing protein [Verrucomicrobia bacterium]|nr:PIN domain-containing protein [Verrucomicrobiota bacterium]
MKLVDTSAWIEFLRNRESKAADRVEALLGDGEAGWCDLIATELWNGARGEKEKRTLQELEEAVTLFPLDSAAWQQARVLAQRCRQAGVTVPTVDVVIAACAFRHGLEIEHHDEHFEILWKVWRKP